MSMSADVLAKLLAAPALAPPDGVVPQFDNPPNDNGLAWFVTTFCMVIATICLFVRAYARLIVLRKAGIEEALMFLAYGAYWGTAYAGYGMIYAPGYYVHTWDLHNGDLIRPLYLILVYGSAYSAVMPLIKSAILLDWCKVLVPDRTRNTFWWCCMGVIGLQATWGIACIILLNMQCVPHAAIYEFYIPAKCYSLPKVMLTSASVQVVTDFVMVALPQRIIWGLQMSLQRKIGISLIFGVGILACVGACVRLSTTVTFANETDTMYFIGPLLFWACAEMTCGFFILCVPCIPKLIVEIPWAHRMLQRFRKTNKSDPDPSSVPPTIGGSGGSRNKSRSAKVLDTYHQIQEDEIPLGNAGKREFRGDSQKEYDTNSAISHDRARSHDRAKDSDGGASW